MTCILNNWHKQIFKMRITKYVFFFYQLWIKMLIELAY